MTDDLSAERTRKREKQISAMKGPAKPGNGVIIHGRLVPHITMFDQGDNRFLARQPLIVQLPP